MWWDLIFRFRKQLLIGAAVIVAFGSGWWYGVSSVEPTVIVEEKIIEKTVIVEKIIEIEKKSEKKNEVVEKTTKIIEHKDGTKETVITEKKETKTDTSILKNKEKDKNTTKDVSKHTLPIIIPPQMPNRWRTGVILGSGVTDLRDISNLDYGISSGMRLFGPVWLDGSYMIKKKNITLGVSVEF